MSDALLQAILSAIRSIMAVAGGILVTHGYLNDNTVNEIIGGVTTMLPVLWGIWEKYQSESKTKAREVVAVNAGIAAGASGQVGDTARPADVPRIIETFKPPELPK